MRKNNTSKKIVFNIQLHRDHRIFIAWHKDKVVGLNITYCIVYTKGNIIEQKKKNCRAWICLRINTFDRDQDKGVD